jgi:hypothetical protein
MNGDELVSRIRVVPLALTSNTDATNDDKKPESSSSFTTG